MFDSTSRSKLAKNKFDPVACQQCGRAVPRADRKQLFCSTVCRKRAHRAKTVVGALKNSARYPSSRHGTTCKNSTTETTTCKGEKPCLRSRIDGRGWQAPQHVIDAHLPHGTEIISAGGVISYVTQIAPRALVERRQWR